MSFMDRLLFKKAPVRPASDEPISPIFTLGGQAVRFLNQQAIVAADVLHRTNPQLFRITQFIATSVQSVPWFCEPDPDVVKTEQAGASQIKAINELLKSPNDTQTPQQLAYWISLNLMLYGRSHFKVGVGSQGVANAIYPLAAKFTKGIINSRGIVEGYEYGYTTDIEKLPTRRVAEKRKNNGAYAAEISYPSLTGLVEYNRAPPALESLAKPLAIIEALMQRALDTAQGHANIKYVITAEKTLTKMQRDALEKHLRDAAPGEEESGSVLFLYNTSVEVHKLDNDLKDVHSKLPLDDMTRQVAGVYGVPIALIGLGSADSAKYASNYEESRRSFWQDTIAPSYLVPISAGLTQAICPYGARIAYDFDSIPAMWQDRAKLGESLSRVNFLTSDEKREILGFEPNSDIPQVMLSSGTAVSPDGAPVDVPVAPAPADAPTAAKAITQLRTVQ